MSIIPRLHDWLNERTTRVHDVACCALVEPASSCKRSIIGNKLVTRNRIGPAVQVINIK